MRNSASGVGLSPALEERLLRPDSPVRRIVLAQAVAKNADGSLCQKVLQKRDDWGTADGAVAGPPASLTGFDFLDNGDVRLHNTVRTIITKPGPPNDYFPSLSRTFPLSVITLEWGGTDRSDIELDRIKIWLNPRVNGALNRQVVKWKLELFALADEIQLQNIVKHQLNVIPLGSALPVDVTSDAEGPVNFDFSTSPIVKRPQPKYLYPPTFGAIQFGVFRHPTTFFVITALDKDGNNATNVGLGYDHSAGSLTSAGNILSTRSITRPFRDAYWGEDSGSANGVPIVTIESGTYASTTISFTTNPLNLGGSPGSTDVQLLLRGNVPTGCGLVGRIRNDADSAYVVFTDGQWMQADLGLTPSTTRKFQVDLNTDASQTVTPTLTGLGMECFTETNFIRQTKVSGGSWAIDPHTMKGQIPEILLTFLRDGDRDYTDAITDLLANNHIGDIRFRLYWGDETLARKDWLHVDDFLIDGSHPRGPDVQLKCLTPLCLLRDNVPPYKPGISFEPTSDITLIPGTLWTTESGGTANLYSHINSVVFDDTTYIRSELDPINSHCEVKLPTITDPAGRKHILNYRYRTDIPSGEQIDLTVTLRQAGSVVVQDVVTNIGTDSAGSATPRSIVLTDDQVASITDYTNLRVRFTANKPSGSGSRRAIITWVQFRTGGKQAPVTYNTTLKGAADGLIVSELGIDARYRGQGVEDIQSINQVGKTMFQTSGPASKPIGKNELDAIAYIAGGGIISSQGKITYRDMFTPGPVRAIFPSSEIRLAEAGPGHEERMPQLFVQWKWNAAKGDFDRQEYVVHAGALLHLGKSRLDPPAWVDQETAKWLSNEGLDANGVSLAGRIGVRQVQAIGPGLMLWRFTSNYRYPQLEPGDVISLQTDKFVGRDPVANRAIRGQQWVTARIQSCDVDAQNFTAWVQSYADMLATVEKADRLGLGPATPHILALKVFVDESGNAQAIVTTNAALALRVASSTAGVPSDATVRAAALQTLDGNGQLGTGVLASLTPGQTIYVKVFAYEKVDGSGLESVGATATVPFGTRKRSHPLDDGLYNPRTGDSTGLHDRGVSFYQDGQFALRATQSDGSTKVSTAHNPQGAILPFVSPLAGTFFSYAAGGPAAGQMWISFDWTSQNLLLPDGTTKTVSAPPAAPAAPVTGTAVSGALGGRTLYAKVAYLKTDPLTGHETLYPMSGETIQVVPANSVLTVTAPADPGGGLYDGWAVLVGNATGVNYVQGVSAKRTFGVNYQEPAGGFSTTQNSLWTASWKSITKIGIDANVVYKHYPYFDVNKNLIYIPADTINPNAQLAQIQNGDGALSLGTYDATTGYSGVVTITTPLGGNTGSGSKGGGRLM